MLVAKQHEPDGCVLGHIGIGCKMRLINIALTAVVLAGCAIPGGTEDAFCALDGSREAPPRGRAAAEVDDTFLAEYPELGAIPQGRGKSLDCERGVEVLHALGREGAAVEGEGNVLSAYFVYNGTSYRVINTQAVD